MKKTSRLGVVPMYIFTLLFVILPIAFLLAVSFTEKSGALEYGGAFTFENYKNVFEGVILKTFLTSFRLSLIVTVFSVLLGYPFGYFMSKCKSAKTKALLLVLVMLPFWTNALVRIYGLIILFRDNGIITNLLKLESGLSFLYTEKAVVFGMVYALLPFMILTVYSACSKIDKSVPEAARDLGATPLKTFITTELPLSSGGLVSGITLVFIPSMSLFFISDLLGGGKVMIAGNLIKDQIMISHNYPFAAAIGVLMLVSMLLCMEITKGFINLVLRGKIK